MDDLQCFSARIKAKTSDMFFRAKFIEDLPLSIHKWALMLPDVFTSDFDTQKAASGKSRAAVASVKKQGLTCPRCSGPHRVRDCTQRRCFKAP